jgi:hypothetical protein
MIGDDSSTRAFQDMRGEYIGSNAIGPRYFHHFGGVLRVDIELAADRSAEGTVAFYRGPQRQQFHPGRHVLLQAWHTRERARRFRFALDARRLGLFRQLRWPQDLFQVDADQRHYGAV